MYEILRIKHEELQLLNFLQKIEAFFGLLLRLFAIRDKRTHWTGVLTIQGGLDGVSHRSCDGARDEHSGPSSCLQNHPMRTAEIQRAAEDQEIAQKSSH